MRSEIHTAEVSSLYNWNSYFSHDLTYARTQSLIYSWDFIFAICPLLFFYPYIINYWGVPYFRVSMFLQISMEIKSSRIKSVDQWLKYCSRYVLQEIDVPSSNSLCFLSTGLSRDQRATLQKCAGLLHADVVEEYNPLGRENFFFWWGFNTLNECMVHIVNSADWYSIIDFWWGLLVTKWSVIGCWSSKTEVPYKQDFLQVSNLGILWSKVVS